MTVGRLWSVTLDCDDPAPLADFWAAMLGGTVKFGTDDFVGVELPNGAWVGAYRVPGYRRAEWPEGDSPKQFHLDVAVDDLDAESVRRSSSAPRRLRTSRNRIGGECWSTPPGIRSA